MLGFLERLGLEIALLKRGDETLLFDDRIRLEFKLARVRRQCVLEFGDRREQAGTVGAQLAVLTTQAKLDREEITLYNFYYSLLLFESY